MMSGGRHAHCAHHGCLLVLVVRHGSSGEVVLVRHWHAIGDIAHHSWVEWHLIRAHLSQHLLLLTLLQPVLLLK